MIMKVCVQWNPVNGCEDYDSSGARTRDRQASAYKANGALVIY